VTAKDIAQRIICTILCRFALANGHLNKEETGL
jgi:hypothetical protein